MKHLSGLMIVGVAIALLALPPMAHAADLQSQIDSDNQAITALNEKIAQYQAQLQQIGTDKKTLQAAIKALDLQRSKVQAQVAATQRQINVSQLQIKQLDDKISDAQESIAQNQTALARYIQAVQETDTASFAIQLFSEEDFSYFLSNIESTFRAQDAIRQKIDSLHAQQEVLSRTQADVQQKEDALASQKDSLASQQQSLTVTVQSKDQLLKQTKAQESTYQKLLSQAQAQLESFSAFSQNAGGAGLIGNQTICDGWGCYYNQRDSAWGALALNGTKYTLAGDGCLVTAMAMVLTHYGYRNVTPVTINANPNNFASYYPAFLLSTISVGGITATRASAAIDATLATGTPTIIGLKAYGGTHFVVIVSGRSGNYVMRDPYIENGKDISFTAHYTMRSIYSIAKVVIGG